MPLGALLLNIVTMNCLRLFQLNGVILNNDATACYDCMIPEVSYLHLQSLGLPDNATKCSVLLNKNMKRKIKTSAEITQISYQHIEEFPLEGEGQGKSLSPSNWLFWSSTLLAALHTLCVGVYLFSACKKYLVQHVAEACVEDADAIYVDQKDQANKTPTSIQDRLKHIAHTWERLIYGSGGKLSRDKMYWWLVWWQWDGKKAIMVTKNDIPITLNITIDKETIP
eukprot:12512863-Ditylum_brightwellii.AAC.1